MKNQGAIAKKEKYTNRMTVSAKFFCLFTPIDKRNRFANWLQRIVFCFEKNQHQIQKKNKENENFETFQTNKIKT